MIEEGLRSIVDHAPDIICTIDAAGRFAWMNKASCRILGYDPEDIVGREFITVVYSEDRPRTLRFAAEVLRGIEVTNFENRFIRQDGSLVPIVWSATWDRRSQTMHCIARDATEKKRAEVQLRRSEQRFRALVQEGSDMIAILNPDATYKYVSPTSGRVLGIDPEYFTGKNAFDFIHPEDHESVMACFEQMETDKIVHLAPFRFRDKDGAWRWVETVLTNLMDDPSIGGIVANSRDVTERLEASQRLEESEKRYRQLFENNPAPMLILDVASLCITDCNESASELYGYTQEEFRQLTIGDLTLSAEEAQPGGTLVGEEDYHNLKKRLWRHRKKNGGIILLEVSGYAMEDGGRRVSLLMMNDVTEKETALNLLRENQAKLANAQKIAMLGYWEFELATKTLYWTEEASAVWGRQQENFARNPDLFLETIHPEDLAIFMETQRNVLKSDTEQSLDVRVLLPGQKYKWVRLIGKGQDKKEGRYRALAGTVQDITEQKNLSLSLQLANQRYTYAGRATSQAIWDWDLTDDSLYWGEGFKLLMGYEVGEAGMSIEFWLAHIHPDDLNRVTESIMGAIAGTSPIWTDEYRFLKKDGTYAFIVDKGFLIRDERGNGVRMVGAMQDITQRKYEEAQKLLNTEISRIFNQSQGLGEAIAQVLKTLVRSGNYRSAEAWLTDPQGKYMHLMEYCGRDTAGSPISKTAVFQKCARGQGLPGQVWQSGSVVQWTSREYAQKSTHRRSLPAGEPVHFYGVPLLYNGSVLGALVMEEGEGAFFSNGFVDATGLVGHHLGGEIRRKQLEQELYQIVNHAQHIICVLDLEGTFRKVNPAACSLLEYGEDELLNRSFINFIHPDDTGQISQSLQGTIHREAGFHFETRSITKSGKVRWLNWTMTIPPGERSILAIAKDTTDQKNLKDLLARANSLARIGGWEFDLVNQSVFWSSITREIFEVAQDHYFPDIASVLQFHTQGWSRQYMEEIVRGNYSPSKKWDTELLITTAKGNQRWVRMIGEAVVINGVCTRAFGSFQDIHESKSAELRLHSLNEELSWQARELALSNAELEQFAYVASHDLQEPLRMITSFLNQLEKKYGNALDEKARRYIYFAVDGATRMRQIILDLLEFSRVGKHEDELKAISLDEVIEEVCHLQWKLIREAKAQIHYAGLPTVRSYHSPLLQVFQNLIGNALKYRRPGTTPEIYIRAESRPDSWLFTITDNGIGIEPEYFGKVFVIFQRLHTREEYGGTGMGLAIVKKIVENLGGKIWIESIVGEGSTFYFEIPKI
jgi:PAS domain S-box-containing protein